MTDEEKPFVIDLDAPVTMPELTPEEKRIQREIARTRARVEQDIWAIGERIKQEEQAKRESTQE